MKRSLALPSLVVACLSLLFSVPARAIIVEFFDASQVPTLVQAGTTSDTVSCQGYLFTYTRDKLFTGGLGGGPIGRPVRVEWPDGVEAQAVTTGPVLSKATITLKRVDGDVFDLPAFSFKLLANTAGAGGNVEIMPKLNGEDGFADPILFFATGNAGNSFSYDTTTPSYLGNTTPLQGFDTYQMTLYVDYAVTALTLRDNSIPEPSGGALFTAGAFGIACWRRLRR